MPRSNSTRWPVESTTRVGEVDLEAELVAVVRLQPRPLERWRPRLRAPRPAACTRMKRRGAFCSSMPALCSRNTKDAAEPSRIGTSSAVMSTYRLSMPRPAQADIRCSTVCTLAPPLEMVDARRVSVTASADIGMSTGSGRSTRRNTMPVSGWRRPQRQLDPLAAVQPHADGAGEGLEGALLEHGAILGARWPVKQRRSSAPRRSQGGRHSHDPPTKPSELSAARCRPHCSGRPQSACLRRNAGISKSSMPPDDSASTLAAAWVRLVRHTLGTAMLP